VLKSSIIHLPFPLLVRRGTQKHRTVLIPLLIRRGRGGVKRFYEQK